MAGMKSDRWSECFYTDGDFTALSNFTSEASLLAGKNHQPKIPGGFLDRVNKKVAFEAWGVLGTTSTPTYIFQCRFGTTVGSSFLSGTSVGVTPTITAGNGVTNSIWHLRLEVWVKTVGEGGTNCTLNCMGQLWSGDAFAVSSYALAPATPPTATFTATLDASVNQWFNLSVTCGTASASNTVTCKSLSAYALN